MEDWRIYEHPILKFNRGKEITIYFNGKPVRAYENESVAAALYANGVREFSRSIKYRRPRGFFCAIGRCSSCLMEVDGVPNSRTCVISAKNGMKIKRQEYLVDHLAPILNILKLTPQNYMRYFTKPGFIYNPAMAVMRQMTGSGDIPKKMTEDYVSNNDGCCEKIATEFLVVGGGPAGLSAAIEAGQRGVEVILVDDKNTLGGQLVKQTHEFFSDIKYAAGKRGYQLGKEMVEKISKINNIKIFTNTNAIGYYPQENTMLLLREDEKTMKISAKKYLVATGAYEKNLIFENNDLPGIYGAGGVQTLLNVYGIKPGNRGLIIGAGNVALMVAYHLIQAGVDVEAVIAPSFKRVKGYFVHAAKITRHGIPIINQHTILKAIGNKKVEGALISKINEKYEPILGTEREIKCDFICIGVGLTPSYELAQFFNAKLVYNGSLGGFVPLRDKQFRITPDAYIAGDCGSIEEATTAVLEGGLVGLYVTRELNKEESTLKGKIDEYTKALEEDRGSPFSDEIKSALEKITIENILEA